MTYFDFSWVYESDGNKSSCKIIHRPLPRGMKDHATILEARKLILGYAKSAGFHRVVEKTGERLTYAGFFNRRWDLIRERYHWMRIQVFLRFSYVHWFGSLISLVLDRFRPFLVVMLFGLIESKRADSKTIEPLNWIELNVTHFSVDFEEFQRCCNSWRS